MSGPSHRLVAAQTADALTFAAFYLFIGAGMMSEQNPLVLAIMAVGGIAGVVAVKVGLAATVVWLYERNRRRRLLLALMTVATLSGVIGAGTNIASILVSI
jgi:hypothetical protein